MKFKNKKDQELFFALHPMLIIIIAQTDMYMRQNFDTEITITATVSTTKEDAILGRKSNSHRTFRAADIRTIGLSEHEIQAILEYLNNNFHDYHYVSHSGKKRLAFRHVGSADHIHVQLHSKFANHKY